MARRVHLHIGVPKSGTTFLQTAMWHNRPALAAQGYLYPGSRRMDHYHASQDVRLGPHSKTASTGTWERLRDELRAWDGDGLISHEFFSMATAEQAAAAVRALAPAQVHVVVTARDYVRQFPAVWQEALKMSSTLSLDDFMDRAFARELTGAWGWQSQDVPAVLARWSAAVPAEQIHVITVPPPSAPRELLWRRWCEVLGIDDSGFDLGGSFSNESLGAPQAALLWRIKPFLTGPLLKKPVQHRWVRQYFGHEVLVPQQGERFGLRPEQAAKLRTLSVAAVESIAAAGYSVVGDLDDLVPAEQQPDRPHPGDISESEMLDVAGRAIDQMIRDVRRLTTERDHWREAAQGGPVRRSGRAVGRLARSARKRVG